VVTRGEGAGNPRESILAAYRWRLKYEVVRLTTVPPTDIVESCIAVSVFETEMFGLGESEETSDNDVDPLSSVCNARTEPDIDTL
jgi:hypothetical protein